MTDYTFKEAPLSENITYAYERWLFHCAGHLHLQSPDGWTTFYAINNTRHTIDAHLHIHIEGLRALSPVRAPFGSCQCEPGIQPVVLYEFLEFSVSRLRDRGVEEIVFTNPPAAYQPDMIDLLTTFLLNLGFEIVVAEAGAILPVNDSFRDGLSRRESRCLRKAERAGLTFCLIPAQELQAIYTFILACRTERGYELSIDWETLRKTVGSFPDRFLLFGVMHETLLAAASIAINVGNGVLVNFHPAHPRDYDHLSPVVMLLDGMVNYGLGNGYRLLDLGTSAIDGKPNFGLLDFKLGVGGIPTTKFTFRKRW